MEENEERRGIEAQRVKHPNPSRANDALIGEEEQNGNRREKTNKQTYSGSPTQLTWTIYSPPTTRMDHMLGLFHMRNSKY